MKLSLILSTALLALSSVACSSANARLQTPDGFAELQNQKSFDYRATNPHGVVLAARVEPNEPAASTEFWSQAIDLRLRHDGYVAETSKEVATPAGLNGKQLRYTRDRGGRPFRYWVTVFVSGKKVLITEATGDRESFDGSIPAVERALLSVKAE